MSKKIKRIALYLQIESCFNKVLVLVSSEGARSTKELQILKLEKIVSSVIPYHFVPSREIKKSISSFNHADAIKENPAASIATGSIYAHCKPKSFYSCLDFWFLKLPIVPFQP